MIKKISILGSTGSIGLSVFQIIQKKKNNFKIILLSANKNYSLICKQIQKYKPKYFIINDINTYKKIKKKFSKNKTKIFNNFHFINKRNSFSNITISAIPGLAGLEPTIKMVCISNKMLIANKESIVCGWNLIKKLAKKNKTKIIPVDSEHFSILELMKYHRLDEIKKVYLTASGGPFLNYSYERLKTVKPQQAINHPKWKMGKKISIDSSTLVNKILEVIEAEKLFEIPNSKIEILIHPESLVHAVIQFKNGLSKLLVHRTSMIIPIANAMLDNNIDISKFYSKKERINVIGKSIIFKKLDKKIFPIIKIKNKITQYPSTPIIINAANELLVEQFIKKNIPFLDIPRFIMAIMKDRKYRKNAIKDPSNLKIITQVNNWAKNRTLELIKKK